MNNIEIDVDLAILSLIKKLQKNPFIVYSEKDLQTFLSLELLEVDKKLYKTNANFNGIQMKTTRVNREYPYVKGSIDIVIFSVKDIKNIDGAQGTKFGYLHVFKKENQKRSVSCSHLIEIKNPRKNTLEEPLIQKDFKKLRERYSISEVLKDTAKLYFFCYHLWDIPVNNYKKIKNQLEIYKKYFEIANLEPEIKFYLLIGPKNKWRESFLKEIDLSQYLKSPHRQIFFF